MHCVKERSKDGGREGEKFRVEVPQQQWQPSSSQLLSDFPDVLVDAVTVVFSSSCSSPLRMPEEMGKKELGWMDGWMRTSPSCSTPPLSAKFHKWQSFAQPATLASVSLPTRVCAQVQHPCVYHRTALQCLWSDQMHGRNILNEVHVRSYTFLAGHFIRYVSTV